MKFASAVALVTAVLAVLSLLAGALTPAAALPPREVTIIVPPHGGPVPVDLSPTGPQLQEERRLVTEPIHGTVTSFRAAGTTYTPDQEFWNLGTDSFEIWGTENGTPYHQTVLLIAGSHRGGLFTDTFDVPPGSTTSEHFASLVDNQGSISLSTAAGLGGGQGMVVTLDQNRNAAAYVVYGEGGTLWQTTTPPGGNGTPGDQDGGAEIKLDVDPNNTFIQDTQAMTVLAGVHNGPGGQQTVAEIQIRGYNGTIQVRAQSNDGENSHSTPWVNADRGRGYRLRIEWWTEGLTSPEGGLRFWVDDKVEGEVSGLGNAGLTVNEVTLGAVNLPVPVETILHFDDLNVYGGALEAAASPAIVEDFEGDLQRWTETLGPNNSIFISDKSAISGSYGLQVAMDSVETAFLVQDLWTGTKTFTARFSVDPTELYIANNQSLQILAGHPNDGAFGASVFNVRLGNLSNEQFKARATVRDDFGNRLRTSWTQVGNDPFELEISWRAASSPLTWDGYLRLWIDGVLVGEWTGLNTSQQAIEAMSFGSSQAVSSAAGLLHFDDFVSWN